VRSTGPDATTVRDVLTRAADEEGVVRCEICGSPIVGSRGWGWSVHHRQGRRGRRTDNRVVNLLLTCGASNVDRCHGNIHRHGKTAVSAGWSLSRLSSNDPAAVPALIRGRRVLLTLDGGYKDAPEEGDAG
jgi:hypothetical protein